MARRVQPITEETKKALRLAARKEQRLYPHKAPEISFRNRIKNMSAAKLRSPKIQYAIGTLGSLDPHRPTDYPYLMEAILEALDRNEKMYPVCDYVAKEIMPNLIRPPRREVAPVNDRMMPPTHRILVAPDGSTSVKDLRPKREARALQTSEPQLTTRQVMDRVRQAAKLRRRQDS